MRFYYGWVVAAICAVVLLLVMGSTVSVYGLYVLPVAREYGLNRADVNTAFVIANLGGALQAPLIGRLVDTIPIRRVMAVGALFYAISSVTIATTQNIWLSAAVLAILMPWAIGGLGTASCMALVARWFEAQRGRAMALVIIGMSLGSVVLSPLVGWLIETVGWRQCAMITGATIGVLVLLLIILLREKPGIDDVEPVPPSARQGRPAPQAGSRAAGKVLSTREILGLPLFWSLAVAMALYMGAMQAISITLVPMAQEGGISVTASAGLLSILGLTGIAGKFALVWIGDRFDKALVLALLLVIIATVLAVLPSMDTYLALALCAGIFGLVSGVTMPLLMALLADYVGAPSFGSANGIATLMVALSGAITMRMSGEIYDRTGGYESLFLALTAMALVAGVFMLLCWKLARARLEPVAA